MRAQSARRLTLALAVLTLLAPAMAQALPSFHVKSLDSTAVEAGKPVSWLGSVWQGLMKLWSQSATSSEGPGLAPVVPTSESSPPGSGAGPYIDPYGGKGNG